MATLTDTSKKIVSGTSVYFFSSITNSVFGLVFVVLATRILGLSDYGLLVLGGTIFDLAGNFGMFGLNLSCLRLLSGAIDKEKKEIIGTMFFINCCVAVIIAAVLFFGAGVIAQLFFGKPLLAVVIKIMGASLLFSLPLNLMMFIFQAQKRVRLYFGINIAKNSFKLLSLVFIFFVSNKLLGVSLSFLFSSLISLILGVYLMPKYGIYPDFSNIKVRLPQQLSLGGQFFVVGIGYFLASQIDRLMLGVMKTSQEVGIFAIAASLAMVLGFVHSGMTSVFMPTISEMHKNDNHAKIKETYYFSNTLVIFVNSLILIGYVTLGSAILKILFGVRDVEGLYVVFLVLSIRYFVGSFTGPAGALLNMAGRQKVEVVNILAFIVLNIVLNVYMIHWWGALGAATATLASVIIVNLAQIVELRKFYGISVFRQTHLVLSLVIIILSLGFFAFGGNSRNFIDKLFCFVFEAILFTIVFYFSLEKPQRRSAVDLVMDFGKYNLRKEEI